MMTALGSGLSPQTCRQARIKRLSSRRHSRVQRANSEYSVPNGMSQSLLWCTEAEEHGFLPWFGDLQAARTEFGRPRSNMRLRTVTAIRVSTSWAGRPWERKVSPMMRLYRLIVPSAPALAL